MALARYSSRTVTLAPGRSLALAVNIRSFSCRSIEGASDEEGLFVRLNDDAPGDLFAGLEVTATGDDVIRHVELINERDEPATIKCAFGQGQIIDRRSLLSGNVKADISGQSGEALRVVPENNAFDVNIQQPLEVDLKQQSLSSVKVTNGSSYLNTRITSSTVKLETIAPLSIKIGWFIIPTSNIYNFNVNGWDVVRFQASEVNNRAVYINIDSSVNSYDWELQPKEIITLPGRCYYYFYSGGSSATRVKWIVQN